MVKKLLGDAVREERLRRNLSQNSLAEPGFYHAANHGRTKFLPGGAETACPFYTAWTSGWIQEPKLRLSRILHHLHIIQRQSVSNL